MENLEDMKAFEMFSRDKVVNNCYFAVRVDGRSFHTEVKRMGFDRPLDKKFRYYMVEASKKVMEDLGAVFAYTESDETTFLFSKDSNIFNRRHEKIVSIVAAKMSVAFYSMLPSPLIVLPTFDARILILPSKQQVIDNFRWRQFDSTRNCISTHCFWVLVQFGVSKKEAQRILNKMPNKEKVELLWNRFGINFWESVEYWEQLGTMIYVEEYLKDGYNPITKKSVKAERKRLVAEEVRERFSERNLKKWINKGTEII